MTGETSNEPLKWKESLPDDWKAVSNSVPRANYDWNVTMEKQNVHRYVLLPERVKPDENRKDFKIVSDTLMDPNDLEKRFPKPDRE